MKAKELIQQVRERELTDKELKRREEIAKDLPDTEFKKKYGSAWKGIKMATATNMAKKESKDPFIEASAQAITDVIKKEDHPNHKKKVKPGYHIMPDGTMMKDSEHKKEEVSKEIQTKNMRTTPGEGTGAAFVDNPKRMKEDLEEMINYDRQLKDPKKETMVMSKKDGRGFVIDRKFLDRYLKMGYLQIEEKDLEKKLNDNVDETLDKIREANIQKSKSMRSLFTDIWKVKEEKEFKESKMGALFLDIQTDAQDTDISKQEFVKKWTKEAHMTRQEAERMHDEFQEENKVEETEKDIYVEAAVLAIAAASRALGEKPIDPADLDNFASDDDRKAADKNIIVQLKRAQDMKGNADVTFLDNPRKKMKVDIKIINKALEMFDKMRPNDKARMQSTISKSYRGLLDTVQRGRV